MKLILNLTVVLLLVEAAVTQPVKIKEGASSSDTERTVEPGIEYFEDVDLDSDKTVNVFEKENIYKTPQPQLAKISDVITNQGQTFQAVTNHLFAPLSIYTSKQPTGYEISAPIPAQLAYTEKITYQPHFPHFTEKITYQPPTSQHHFHQPHFPHQFTEKITYQSQTSQNPQNSEEKIKYQPQFSQHVSEKIVQQPQFTQQQNTQAFAQNETPNLPYQQFPFQATSPAPLNPQAKPFQNNPFIQPQSQLLPKMIYLHPQLYNQAQFPFQNPFQLSPQPLQYAPQQITNPIQEDVKTVQPDQENFPQQTGQTFNNQNQGAFSYASFSVGPTVSLQQQNQPKPQVQQHLSTPQIQQNNPQPQIQQHHPQIQVQQYQSLENPQPYQLQTQPQFIHYSTQIPSYQPQQQTQSQQVQYREPEQHRTYSTEIPSYQPQQHQFREPDQRNLQATENKGSEPLHQSPQQYEIQREPPPSKSINRFHQKVQQRLTKKLKPFFVNPLRIQPKNAQQNHIPSLLQPLTFSYNNDQPKKYYMPDPEVNSPNNDLSNESYYHNNFPAQRLLPTTTLASPQFYGKYAREIFSKYHRHNRLQYNSTILG